MASNAMGTSYGSDAAFTTSAASPPTDTSAPTAPGSLVGSAGDAQVSLSWSASTDNVGVSGYRVFRDGSRVAQSSATSFTDSGLANGTSYSYYVVAFDTAGNVSAASNTISATPVAATSRSSSYTRPCSRTIRWLSGTRTDPGGSEMDFSGNGHNGSYKGGAAPLVAMPNGDKAADFNGSSQYMSVPSNAAFSIPTTHNLTWEAWIRARHAAVPATTAAATSTGWASARTTAPPANGRRGCTTRPTRRTAATASPRTCSTPAPAWVRAPTGSRPAV